MVSILNKRSCCWVLQLRSRSDFGRLVLAGSKSRWMLTVSHTAKTKQGLKSEERRSLAWACPLHVLTGTCESAAAARRSQAPPGAAARARAPAPPVYDAGVHLRPRLDPANSLEGHFQRTTQ